MDALEAATASLTRALAAVPAGVSPRVWLDVGTSYKTLAKWDVLHNDSLVLVGVDALKRNVEHIYQPQTPRFVRVAGACTEGPPGQATFNVHRSPTCGTLMPTRSDAPKLGTGEDACTGDEPVPTRVPTFPLRMLLRSTQRVARRVELLKIDVQGAELVCLRSAGAELRRVDHVLLEVQDADEQSGLLVYQGAPALTQLDALLGSHGLRRQYCEWNRWATKVREINCLYSSERAASPLWATGNSIHVYAHTCIHAHICTYMPDARRALSGRQVTFSQAARWWRMASGRRALCALRSFSLLCAPPPLRARESRSRRGCRSRRAGSRLNNSMPWATDQQVPAGKQASEEVGGRPRPAS